MIIKLEINNLKKKPGPYCTETGKKCWIRKHRTERYEGQGQRIHERVKFINNEYEDQAKEVWLFKKVSVE